MGRRTIFFTLLFTVVCVGSLVAASEYEETLCIPLGTLTLGPPEGVEPKRAAVDFPHSLHFEYSCMECHHMWEGDEEILSCSTSGCHDLVEAPDPSEQDERMLYYKAAYHKLCIGCHKEIKSRNRQVAQYNQSSDARIMPTGPTGCVQCHPKE
jgi:hypothetical protein